MNTRICLAPLASLQALLLDTRGDGRLSSHAHLYVVFVVFTAVSGFCAQTSTQSSRQ